MTERHGSGDDDQEHGQRPSGRGAVTERVAMRDDGAREIDLTDEAVERESAGAFEPAPADPPAGATDQGSSSIFDLGQRAKEEDQERTGYEPAVADSGASEPHGVTVVTEQVGPGAGTTDAGTTDADLDAPAPATDPPAPATDPSASLLASLDAGDIRSRFLDIQAGFVDEPRQAVEEAGRFVDDLVQQVIDALQGQRGQLGATVTEGSTEDLRLALRAYRQFVDRLVGLAD
jgi:hypothetical protein